DGVPERGGADGGAEHGARVVQAGHGSKIWAVEMVGDSRRPERNGRAVADAVSEREKGQADEARPDGPGKKQYAQRNVKRAQSPLTSQPVGSMAEDQPAGE